MSAPTTTVESKPSPWLIFAVPIACSVFTAGVVWGALSSDQRHLERRVTTAESGLAQVATTQSNAAIQAGRLEEQIAALSREVARLTRAIDNLTNDTRASR